MNVMLKMKPIPDRVDEFLKLNGVLSVNDEIREKTRTLAEHLEQDVDKARAIFEWVRDNIPHTKDIEGEVVTCSAIDVLKQKTGICFAKSHLVATMMRLEGIPCGFCYQLFDNEVSVIPDSRALHGLNAIFLESSARWHRIDPRGNRDDVHAEFSTNDEILAFPDMDFLDDCVYAEPLEPVVSGLSNAKDMKTLWPNLPSIANT